MKLIIKIVWISIYLFCALVAKAQTTDWNVSNTIDFHTIFINDPPKSDSSVVSLENNDIIGVFYTSGGTETCAGKLTWQGHSDTLMVYGKDSIANGYNYGQPFTYKIWKSSQNCIIDSVIAYYSNSDSLKNYVSGGSSTLLYFKPIYASVGFNQTRYCDNAGIIQPTNLRNIRVTYSSTENNIDSSTGQINLNGTFDGIMNIKMTSQTCLLKSIQALTIDSSPKLIAPSILNICATSDTLQAILQEMNSLNTVRGIKMDSIHYVSGNIYSTVATNQHCAARYSQQVNIIPEPVINLDKQELCESVKLTIKNTPGTVLWSNNSTGNEVEINSDSKIWIRYTDSYGCSKKDTVNVTIKKLTIDTLSIVQTNADCYREGELTIQNINVLNNVGSQEVLLKNTITNDESTTNGFLKEGRYQLYVKDSRGCTSVWRNQFTILKDCLNDNPVFSPNNDAKDDDFYINYHGDICIYDKIGQLKAKLNGPTYWTGTDQNGNRLPTGIYLLVTGKDAKTITILR
jgi:hypothetical protein